MIIMVLAMQGESGSTEERLGGLVYTYMTCVRGYV